MKKVCQYTQDMVLVATYPSTRKAASAVGMSPTAISMNCLGRTQKCGGYIFIFAPNEEDVKKQVESIDKKKLSISIAGHSPMPFHSLATRTTAMT